MCVFAVVLYNRLVEKELKSVLKVKSFLNWLRKKDTALVIGFSSFSISIIALVVSIATAVIALRQMEITRTHNRRSVMPTLQITTHLEGESGRNGIYISNDGLGPAYVKSFSAEYDGVIESGLGKSKWYEILEMAVDLPICFSQGWPAEDAVLRPGLETPLLHVTGYKNMSICGTQVAHFMEVEPIDFVIAYESGYGDKQVLRKSSGQRLKSSEQSRNDYFSGNLLRSMIRRSIE